MKRFSSLSFIILCLLAFIKIGCSDITGSGPVRFEQVIKSVIPAAGPYGAEITIKGRGFGVDLDKVKLYFNDSQATLKALKDTLIRVRVPLKAHTGPIEIIIDSDTLSGPVFTVDTTRSVFLGIIDITPNQGMIGDQIRIRGTGFAEAPEVNSVLFNNVLAEVKSATSNVIHTTVPQDAITGPVKVIVGQDTVIGPTFTVNIQRSLKVNIKTTGKPESGDGYTLRVENRKDSKVNFNDTRQYNDFKAEKLQVTLIGLADNCRVKGENPREVTLLANELTTTAFNIICQDISPVITKVTPASGTVGTRVTIKGMHFSPKLSGNKVTFNGTAAKVIKASESALSTSVPEGATNGPVKVTVDGRTAVGTMFTVQAKAPLITKLDPQSGVVGTTVIISGENFSDRISENKVTFNGTQATVKKASKTKITTSVPKGASDGPVKVTVGKKSGTGPDFDVITTGMLNVRVVTKGENLDENGYLISIDDSRAVRIKSNDTLRRTLEQGGHKVEIDDIAPNCSISSDTPNPLNTTVNAGKTTRADYTIVCEKPNEPPTASFEYKCENLNCTFDGSGSSDPDGAISRYQWTFGDGSGGKGKAPTHAYNKAGTFTVKLTVTDADQASADKSRKVVVHVPTVQSLSPSSGPAGTEVTINGRGFSPDKSENKVSFTSGSGKINAPVKSAGETKLVVDVPGDATTGPVYVSTYGYQVEGPAFTVEINMGPKASFTYTCENLDCAFDASASNDDGEITAYEWQFGDGTEANGKTVDHEYKEPGSYTVKLIVTDDDGAKGDISKEVTVQVPNKPPTAFFTYACKNLSCDFDGSGSSDPDGTIASYSWDYGEYGAGTGSTVSHHFEVRGTYTVTLTVTDNEGASNSIHKDVTVTNPQITGINPTSGPVGIEVTISGSGFSSTTSDNKVLFTSGGSDVNATIKSASETQLIVDVPSDATTGAVYVSTYGYRVSGPVFTVEQPGALQVDATIEGTQLDTDGYTVTVNSSASKPISYKGSVTFNGIYDNSVQVELRGVASNCRVDGENPRAVTIAAADLVSTTFNVDCTQNLKGKIIFASDRTGNNDIFMQDGNGGSVQQITQTNDYEYVPKLSPDGLKIAYIAYGNGRQVFVMDSDGSDVQQITNSGYYSSVDWNPDQTKLVVSRSDNSDAPADIYTMDVDGANLQNITNTSTASEADPDWSHTGNHIVYESYGNGYSSIYTVNADGSNKTQITNGTSDRQPERSPDGSKIAFVRNDGNGVSRIYIMNADGSSANVLAANIFNSTEKSPTWSPDGNNLAFSKDNDGYLSIFIYSFSSNELTSSPYTPSDDITPHWNY